MAYRPRRRASARPASRSRRPVSRRGVAARRTRRSAPRRAQTVRIVVQAGGAASANPVMLSQAGTMMVPQSGKARF